MGRRDGISTRVQGFIASKRECVVIYLATAVVITVAYGGTGSVVALATGDVAQAWIGLTFAVAAWVGVPILLLVAHMACRWARWAVGCLGGGTDAE